MTNELTDIFGQVTNEGDTIAAGMSLGQSSVLRVGTIIAIKEGHNEGDFSVRVKWTHNGENDYKWAVKESSIQIKGNYSYAKFVRLPAEFVAEFPADIPEE